MDTQTAQRAMREGLRVRGTDEHGNTHEGTIEWEFVVAPVGYRVLGPVSPASAPVGNWGPRRYRVQFKVSPGLVSSADYTADQLELVDETTTPAGPEPVLNAAEMDAVQHVLKELDLQCRALLDGFEVVMQPLDAMVLAVKLSTALGPDLTGQLLDRLTVRDHDDASFSRHGFRVYSFRGVDTAWEIYVL